MLRELEPFPTGFRIVRLPWGSKIRVNIGESQGSNIWRTGVHDLCVLECLWRLIDPGDWCIDVGANIGLMTNLMALRSGTDGRVYSIEPHPILFEELKANVTRWPREAGFAEIKMVEAAATRCDGKVRLEVPDLFHYNRGVSRVLDVTVPSSSKGALLEVPGIRLESMVQASSIGVMKVDVEGHELSVFQGCGSLLEKRKIRDIVYESFIPHPNPATALLWGCGYTVFAIQQSFNGLRPIPLTGGIKKEMTENFLATCEPKRLLDRLGRPGWFCLSGKLGD